MRLVLPETYQSQVQHIQESAKFRPGADNQGYQPAPFPGYSIITPPAIDDTDNSSLHERLTHYQQQTVDLLGSHFFAPVPPASFHLTLADLIWDSAYRHATESNSTFDAQLQTCISEIFQQSQMLSEGKPIQFQPVGLMVMTRAIAICLVPTEEHAYERILKFRRAVYQNSQLIGLGVEQQYYFTPHITLGYFGNTASEDRDRLSQRFEELNQQWLSQDLQAFSVHRAELRKFDDMTNYYREPACPSFEF